MSKKSKPLLFSRAYRQSGKPSAQLSRTAPRSLHLAKQSNKSYQKTFEKSRWDLPSTSHNVEPHSSTDTAQRTSEAKVGSGGKLIAHRRSRRTPTAHTIERSVQCCHCWVINKKGSGPQLVRNLGLSDSNHLQIGNQANIAKSRSGEVLSLEDLSTREILYNTQDARMWLLHSRITFHVTPHTEWFSNY